jgi:uridylate kinase
MPQDVLSPELVTKRTGKPFKRVLLKISGEAFGEKGVSGDIVESIASQVKDVGVGSTELAVVVGGGNIIRGQRLANTGINRGTADYMGMLGTVINAMALQDILEEMGVPTRVLSALTIQEVAEPYVRRRAIRHLEKGRVVIFAGGTGNPHFTTDTTAALRATEIGAEVVLKATKVDGIYDKDPVTNADAVRFKSLGYLEILNKRLEVMDSTAITLCMEHQMPIIVFDLKKEGNIQRVINGEDIGTYVGD